MEDASVSGGTVRFDGFRKRDGVIVPFDAAKIESAVARATEAVSRRNGAPHPADLPARATELVLAQLDNPASEYYVHPNKDGLRVPRIEDVQDVVEIVLTEQGEGEIATAYKRYRKQREVARGRISVRDRAGGKRGVDVTDASMLVVESVTSNETAPWDRHRISEALRRETDLAPEMALGIAKAVENHVISSGLNTISTTLIRELVNNELIEHGFHAQLRDLSIYGISKTFVESLMFTKSTENSNIVNNNPEAVNLGLAELILKQWALDTIFTPEVKRAHDTGAIHLHDLGYPHRVYCSSHSIEYVKKYGLSGLLNLNTESKPARSASVLTGHLNTFLASMQANYAGALGIAYINIFYAPYLVGMSRKQLKQVAQELIFNGSQNAFSRGGQTLFLDFNIHTGVPRYLMNVPAVGPGGHYMMRRADGSLAELEEQVRDDLDANGNSLVNLYVREADGSERVVLREIADKTHGMVHDPEVCRDLAARGEKIVVYGDFVKEAQAFTEVLLEVWREGDRFGRVFEFPKCDFHVSDETFHDPEQYRIFMEACELASHNGSTYFIFDREEVTLSACCRLRTTITDNHLLQHPESLRFCGFQNVTINIPQAAYRAARAGAKTLEGLYAELDRTMDLVVQAHLQKKNKIAIMMSEPGRPLYQIGKKACDGRPYVDLDKCTYIIGLIGLNDAIRFLFGEELHHGDRAMEIGLRIVAHMYLRTRKLSKKHGLKFSLEESPAESAARRLAKTDLIFFENEARDIVKGENRDVAYYTNSVHLAADAPVTLIERIRRQSEYHSLIESGAIIHAFVGEERPDPAAVASLIRDVFHRTQAAQVTISPEFTYCNCCFSTQRGLKDNCNRCGSDNVVGETRVVGYFSKIPNWNKSKRYGELPARQRGDYSVAESAGLVTAETAEPATGLVTA
jgi:anaerobic ribonucleoside-triphosphate reductase